MNVVWHNHPCVVLGAVAVVKHENIFEDLTVFRNTEQAASSSPIEPVLELICEAAVVFFGRCLVPGLGVVAEPDITFLFQMESLPAGMASPRRKVTNCMTSLCCQWGSLCPWLWISSLPSRNSHMRIS